MDSSIEFVFKLMGYYQYPYPGGRGGMPDEVRFGGSRLETMLLLGITVTADGVELGSASEADSGTGNVRTGHWSTIFGSVRRGRIVL